MAGFSAFQIQKAIDTVLSNDATLLALLGTSDDDSIYDNTSQTENAIYPYIVYISNTLTPFDSKTFQGSDVTFTIGAYSESGDKEEASNILERIHTLLHNSSLTVDSNDFILCQWDGLSEILVDDRNELILIQGIIRFRILTKES